MYHVVLAVDENEERAESAAREVANLPGDPDEKRVTLVHVFQDNPSGASATQVASVRAAEDVLDAAGLDVEISEASGDPADVILDVAAEAGADLLVVGGRKRSPAGKALFGSVTQSVILNADRPVMVAGVVRQA
ncbi:universal stress protein [Halorarum halophilum]|uniref:Universal stress protein n=1 Tax=Halorarum halophilum TaxID=2743090 RepID=A0A7D5GD21_9EURY|nr:universal stress protein [Halobaculum halophilum]QLG28625.1 universal stress protein [Halobaculum halophilum]